MTDDPQLPIHDDPDRLRDALSYTASQTSFGPRLIEKDYYSSLLLRELEPVFKTGLVFKGGTALSKVHAGFYRLSEDLDFAISIDAEARRSERRTAIAPVKRHLQQLCSSSATFHEVQSLTGADSSHHYVTALRYRSCLSESSETLRVETGLREPVVESPTQTVARTLLFEPVTSQPAVQGVPVTVMSHRESYAEKIRAALCRREPAIRDLYDLDYALQAGVLDVSDTILLRIVQQKLAVPGNDSPDVSPSRLSALRRQVESELRPVLRQEDFDAFQLDRAFEVLSFWTDGFASYARNSVEPLTLAATHGCAK